MAEAMRERQFAAIVRTGLVLPRQSVPGRTWQPHTDAERHLLVQAQRLDGTRRWLVEEVGRMRQLLRDLGITDDGTPRVAPPPVPELQVLAAAAAGEGLAATGQRLQLTVDAVKSRRVRAVRRMGARNLTHAVALAMAAGLISVEPAAGGEDR